MNWPAISFDWNQIRAVLATAEEGSFSGAARVLGTTQPTIGRQVTGLEEALGVTLFERTVRGPILTASGHELIDHLRAMGEAAALISLVASGQSSEVAGDVTVTASDLMATAILPPMLATLQREAPAVRIHVVASSAIENLTQRAADIAIRHRRPEEPDLIARHLGDARATLYASRSYLDQFGRPATTGDLAGHRFLGTSEVDRFVDTLRARGVSLRSENIVATSNSGAAIWEMVREGMGLALLPEALGAHEATVEPVMPSLPPIEFPIWLVTHRELRTNARIRLVYDSLARSLKALTGPARGN